MEIMNLKELQMIENRKTAPLPAGLRTSNPYHL